MEGAGAVANVAVKVVVGVTEAAVGVVPSTNTARLVKRA